MNTPHCNPDSGSWFQPEDPGFQPPEQRRAGPWAGDPDPLTGPLPPGNDVRASIAEAQEGVYSTGPAGGAGRQHAERVPRYAGQPRPAGEPAERSDEATTAPPDAPPGESATAARETVSAEARFEPRTNALPTMAPTSGQPAGSPPPVPGQPPAPGQPPPGQPPGAGEPGIPPSLAPMLGNEVPADGQSPGYVQHTEPIARPGTPGAPGAAPLRPGAPPGAPGSSAGNPAVTVAVVLGTLLAVVPSLWLVYDAVFGGERVSASGAVSGTLMLVGLPFLAAGVRPLIAGAGPDPVAGGAGPALLRRPSAYLVVGLVLLLAAGLAAT